MSVKYTKEICHLEALKYTYRGDFRRYSPNIYDASCHNNWLDEICSHMVGRIKRKAGWWDNIEHCKETALRYNTPQELRKAENGCHHKIITKHWQAICFAHMDYRPREYQVEDLKRMALECKSSKEFKNKYSGAYRSAKAQGIYDHICSHMPQCRTQIKYSTPLNKENCRNIALKFETKSEFQKYENGRWYQYAIRQKIKDEICSHMRTRGNKKKRCIYVAKFSDNSIYVGLTCDAKRRWEDHLSEDSSAVFLHIQKTGLKPVFEIVHDYVSVEKAQKLEAEYEQKYVEEGWIILNRATTGALGSVGYTKKEVLEVASRYSTLKEFREKAGGYYEAGYRSDYWNEIREICRPHQHTKYTKTELKTIAQKYTQRFDFYLSKHGAYEAAKKMGILDEICAHMSKTDLHRWNEDEVLKVARQCKTKKEFRIRFPREYGYAYRKKRLDYFCLHMEPLKREPSKWTDEAIAKEAKKYKTYKEFRKGSLSAYTAAKKKNKLDVFCLHMLPGTIPYVCNTLEDAYSLALKCHNRTELKQIYNKAYEMLRVSKELNKACSHMVKYKKPIQKWTPEARAIAAKQCKTRTEFHKKYPWAHHLASLNEGELDRICEHMVKPKR